MKLSKVKGHAILAGQKIAGRLNTSKTTSGRAIRDYKRYLKGKSQPKRALLSYLTQPVLEEAKGNKTVLFSNHGIAVSWVAALNELGYIVDVVDWDDTSVSLNQDYDLFISHGAKNYAWLKSQFRNKPAEIYFSTGSYWKFHNEKELERLEYFTERHGLRLPPDRYIHESEEGPNLAASGIICLGNSGTAETYTKFPIVRSLPVGSYPSNIHVKPKDFSLTRKNFFFFSGGGNIHKGLDLLLDSVADTDINLYIGTKLDPEFEKHYADQLYKSSNIHYLGFVDITSDVFREAASACAFIILPSCSEGSPGSVVDCMQLGLIPVVSQEAHIDTDGVGFTLGGWRINELRVQMEKLSGLDAEQLSCLSGQAKAAALKIYSPDNFRNNLKEAVNNILSQKGFS